MEEGVGLRVARAVVRGIEEVLRADRVWIAADIEILQDRGGIVERFAQRLRIDIAAIPPTILIRKLAGIEGLEPAAGRGE